MEQMSRFRLYVDWLDPGPATDSTLHSNSHRRTPLSFSDIRLSDDGTVDLERLVIRLIDETRSMRHSDKRHPNRMTDYAQQLAVRFARLGKVGADPVEEMVRDWLAVSGRNDSVIKLAISDIGLLYILFLPGDRTGPIRSENDREEQTENIARVLSYLVGVATGWRKEDATELVATNNAENPFVVPPTYVGPVRIGVRPDEIWAAQKSAGIATPRTDAFWQDLIQHASGRAAMFKKRPIGTRSPNAASGRRLSTIQRLSGRFDDVLGRNLEHHSGLPDDVGGGVKTQPLSDRETVARSWLWSAWVFGVIGIAFCLGSEPIGDWLHGLLLNMNSTETVQKFFPQTIAPFVDDKASRGFSAAELGVFSWCLFGLACLHWVFLHGLAQKNRGLFRFLAPLSRSGLVRYLVSFGFPLIVLGLGALMSVKSVTFGGLDGFLGQTEDIANFLPFLVKVTWFLPILMIWCLLQAHVGFTRNLGLADTEGAGPGPLEGLRSVSDRGAAFSNRFARVFGNLDTAEQQACLFQAGRWLPDLERLAQVQVKLKEAADRRYATRSASLALAVSALSFFGPLKTFEPDFHKPDGLAVAFYDILHGDTQEPKRAQPDQWPRVIKASLATEATEVTPFDLGCSSGDFGAPILASDRSRKDEMKRDRILARALACALSAGQAFRDYNAARSGQVRIDQLTFAPTLQVQRNPDGPALTWHQFRKYGEKLAALRREITELNGVIDGLKTPKTLTVDLKLADRPFVDNQKFSALVNQLNGEPDPALTLTADVKLPADYEPPQVPLEINKVYVAESALVTSPHDGSGDDALPFAVPTKCRTRFASVYFANGSAALDHKAEIVVTVDSGAHSLATAAGMLARRLPDDGSVFVLGHTDATGPMAGNLSLSRDRARSVANALTNSQPDLPITRISGIGEIGWVVGRKVPQHSGGFPLTNQSFRDAEARRADIHICTDAANSP